MTEPVEKDLTLGDFVTFLVARLQEEAVAMPKRNQSLWHKLFYDLKVLDFAHKPPAIAGLEFDWDGPTPRSRDLADFMLGLHCTSNMSASNPSYQTFSLPEETERLWLERYHHLESTHKPLIDAAVNKAKTLFGVAH